MSLGPLGLIAPHRRGWRSYQRSAAGGGPPPGPSTPGPDDIVAFETGSGKFLWYPQEYGALVGVDESLNQITGTVIGTQGAEETRLGLLGLNFDGTSDGIRWAYPGAADVASADGQSVTVYVLFEWGGITGTDTICALGPDASSDFLELVTSQFRNVNSTLRVAGASVFSNAGNLFGPSRAVYAVTFVYDTSGGGGNESLRVKSASSTGLPNSANNNTSASLQDKNLALDYVFAAISHSAGVNSFGEWIAMIHVVEGQPEPELTLMSQMLSLPGRVTLPAGYAPSDMVFYFEPAAAVARDPLNGWTYGGTSTPVTRGGLDAIQLPLLGSWQGATAASVAAPLRSVYVVHETSGPNILDDLVFNLTDGTYEFKLEIVAFTANVRLTASDAGGTDTVTVASGVVSGEITLWTAEHDGVNFRVWRNGNLVATLPSARTPAILNWSTLSGNNTYLYYNQVSLSARDTVLEAELTTRFNVGTSP